MVWYPPGVDAELLTLRGDIHTAGKEYYRATPECYETATPREGKAVSEGTFLSAAGAYGEALSHLPDHLTTLEQTPPVFSEAGRTRRLIDLQGREVRATRRFIPLCSSAPAPTG
jgi:hypothetical protein